MFATPTSFAVLAAAVLAATTTAALPDGDALNGSTPIAMAYGRHPQAAPWYRTYTGSAWTSAAPMPSGNTEAWWVVLRNAPTRDELAFGELNADRDVKVCFWNGTSWGPMYTCTSSTNINSDRAFDVAYEQLTGDAIVVYWNAATQRIGYRWFNGTSLSSESTVTPPTAFDIRYVSLVAKPQSDEILLLTLNTSNDLNAYIWNGSSFGSQLTLEWNMGTSTYEAFSAAYEGLSHRALVVYREGDLSTPRYRTWNGSSWSSEQSVPSIGAKPRYLRLEARPDANEIIFASLDDKKDINLNVWNGSSWGTNVEVTVAAKYGDRRCYDIAYEPNTGHAIVAYSKGGQNRVNYRTWNGSSWSAEGTGTDLVNECRTIQLRRGLTTGQVHLLANNDDNDLVYTRWDGSSWSATRTVLDANLADASSTEQFMIAVPAAHKILSWTEVAP